MIFQFFHQADLSFLFYRFVSRTVFTYAECVVCPDEFHWLFHQSSHTYGRFHVVGEYEEGTASSDHTTVERHTDTDTSH